MSSGSSYNRRKVPAPLVTRIESGEKDAPTYPRWSHQDDNRPIISFVALFWGAVMGIALNELLHYLLTGAL